MKIDPNKHCIMYNQTLIWAFIHDVISHPLMAFSLYRVDLFIKFHDYTSAKAWCRE